MCLFVLPGILFANVPVGEPPLSSLVGNYCVSCHNPEENKGKLDLETILGADLSQHVEIWEEVAWMLREREMPPQDEADLPRPSEAEYVRAVNWLDERLGENGSTAQRHKGTRDVEESAILAVVEQYCISCHNAQENKGGMDLDAFRWDDVQNHPELWETVFTRLQSRQMPPPDRKRPDEATYAAIVADLSKTLDEAARRDPKPGRTETFRRLNRTEYQNAIRDLLALEIDAANLLPKDEESHGFDNVTVGVLSPSLLDRYISAAQKVSRLAVGAPHDKPRGDNFRIPADYTQEKHVEGLPLGTRGGALLSYTFPQDGEYEIEIRLMRDRNEHVEGLREPHVMEILLDDEVAQRFTIDLPTDRRDHSAVDRHLRTRKFVEAGPRRVGVTFLKNPFSLSQNKRQPFQAHFNFHRHPRRSPAVYQISITGPYGGRGSNLTPSRGKIFIRYPKEPGREEEVAREILAHLMRRAYRRPISEGDLAKPMDFYREGAGEAQASLESYSWEAGFEAGIETALSSILVNPEFIFRIERDPEGVLPGEVYRISDLELATRLSFFIWSSLPDDELLAVAIEGTLSQPDVLEKQVRRMLADARSSNLVNNFAEQWLHLRNLESVVPDLRLFPDFDDNLRRSLRRETELFFESVLREDRSVLDLLKADYTYLNERLAHHYDIPHVFGSRYRRVELDPSHKRGGLLRHGSILTATSYATRTSPVIRGNWVLENIIGTPAPPPLPDVPALDETKVAAAGLSVRKRLEQHRANPACASCHNLMDPVGFALENFDAIGRWRDFQGGEALDVSGGLPDGSVLEGVEGLEDGLLERPELFVRTLSQKLLTFSLGRGVEYYDAPAIREIVRNAKANDYRFSSIVLGIAQSVPFQMRTRLQDEYASAPSMERK